MISSTTLLAAIAILVTVMVALIGGMVRVAQRMGEFNSALVQLSEAIEKLADLGDRVIRLETQMEERFPGVRRHRS